MEYEWTIRFDAPFDADSGIIKYLGKISDKLVIYEHPAKNTGKVVHCHGYITTNTTAKSIRENIKKYVNIKGYCMQVESMMKCFSYMSKGKYDPVLNKNVDDTLITNAKALGFDKEDLLEKAGAEAATKIDLGTSETVPRKSKYLVSHLANECVAECIYIHQEGLQYEYSTIQRVSRTCQAKERERVDDKSFQGRLHRKFQREILEHVLNWYFPTESADDVAEQFWKYRGR